MQFKDLAFKKIKPYDREYLSTDLEDMKWGCSFKVYESGWLRVIYYTKEPIPWDNYPMQSMKWWCDVNTKTIRDMTQEQVEERLKENT